MRRIAIMALAALVGACAGSGRTTGGNMAALPAKKSPAREIKRAVSGEIGRKPGFLERTLYGLQDYGFRHWGLRLVLDARDRDKPVLLAKYRFSRGDEAFALVPEQIGNRKWIFNFPAGKRDTEMTDLEIYFVVDLNKTLFERLYMVCQTRKWLVKYQLLWTEVLERRCFRSMESGLSTCGQEYVFNPRTCPVVDEGPRA